VNKLLTTCLFVLFSLVVKAQTGPPKNIKDYIEKTSDLDPIEGIWLLEIKQEFYHFDTLYNVKDESDTSRIAIVKNGHGFTAYYIKDKNMTLEYAALEFTTTDVSGVYMYSMLSNDPPAKKHAVICTHGKMEYTYDLPEEDVIKYLGTDYRPNTRIVNILKWKKIFPDSK
jgi:hypothetical protein